MENNTIVIEDARLMFTNFSGFESKFNAKGNRNFSVVIPSEDAANKLISDGWHIRVLQPRNDDELPIFLLKVKVNFNSQRPPKVVMVTQQGNMTNLNEETINLLDSADIVKADVEINPYRNEKFQGVSAYLKTLYVTISEDRFAEKYAQEESPVEF